MSIHPLSQTDNRDTAPRRAGLTGAQWTWYNRASDVPWNVWNALPDPSAFNDERYLRAMENHGKVHCRMGLLIGAEGQAWGAILMQAVHCESRSPEAHMEVSTGVRLFSQLLHPGGRPLRFRTLVAGHSLGTGEHAFRWREDVPMAQRVQLTEAAFEDCARHWGIRIWMAKDFGPTMDEALRPHWSKKWVRATFDPLMVTPLDPQWTGVDAWMDALRTKARTKVRGIRTKGVNIAKERVEDPDTLRTLGPELMTLYQQVYGRASMVMGSLEPKDFANLCDQWGRDFLLVTHRLDGRLVGFHCGLHHAAEGGGTIEAYFVGFDPELNKQHALYQGMLIHFIEWGIQCRAKRVILSRTALEIKSTLGALPIDMSTWIHVRWPLAMPVIRWMVRSSPPLPFEPRRAWRSEWSGRWKSEGYRVKM